LRTPPREDDARVVRLALDFFDADSRPLDRFVLDLREAPLDADFFELDCRPLDFLPAIASLPLMKVKMSLRKQKFTSLSEDWQPELVVPISVKLFHAHSSFLR
jgi:hypothetical protein